MLLEARLGKTCLFRPYDVLDPIRGSARASVLSFLKVSHILCGVLSMWCASRADPLHFYAYANNCTRGARIISYRLFISLT